VLRDESGASLLPAHRSTLMHAWLRQGSWLVVESLPAYAPELNPVEPLWASLKGLELANLAAATLEEVIAAAERGIQRIRHTHHLAFSFLPTAGCPGGEQPRVGCGRWCAWVVAPVGSVVGPSVRQQAGGDP
jgi:hypothetical protein